MPFVRNPVSKIETLSRALDEAFRDPLELLTADEVIVYCACPNEASAAAVAKKLMRAGFKRVRPLAGGIEAWVERGYGIETVSGK